MRLSVLLSLLLATVALGSAAGFGAAYYRFGVTPTKYTFSKSPLTRDATSVIPAEQALRPRLMVVGDSTHDFGVMSRNERRSHTFVVENKGNATLEIGFIDKSCQCTDVVISRPSVAPGETTEIELVWRPSSYNPVFEQTARFRTNDPGRIELDLTVHGKVLQVIQFEPYSISFDNVTRGQGRKANCRLFAYQHADLEITQTEFLVPELSDFFDVTITPLSAEVVAGETGAVAGHDIRIRLKPGMPIGQFQQRLRVHLNQTDMVPREIPIFGSIVGNIGIYGPGYQRDQLWNLGVLPGGEQHERKLWILVKGERRESVNMEVLSVDPAHVLEATLTPPPSDSKLARYMLSLRIKPTGEVVNRLGNQTGDLAEIVIGTSLEEAPEIRIPVSFGIESNLNP